MAVELHAQETFSSRHRVSQLLDKTSSQRSVAEQKLIVRQSLPVPKLNLKTRKRLLRRMTGSVGSEGKQAILSYLVAD